MGKKKQKLVPSTDLTVASAETALSEKNYELLERQMNIELKQLHMSEKRLFLQEKQQQIEQMELRRMLNEERKTAVEMLDVITNAMRGHVIDSERTILGSEPHYVPIFDEIERGILKNKMLDIVKRF